MKNIMDWSDTLEYYLRASNEDKRIIEFIKKDVLPKIAILKDIRWLEIGPGLGTKTIHIAKAINKMADVQLHSFCMLEPSSVWRQYLSKTWPVLTHSADLSERTFEEFAHDTYRDNVEPPNFITCIHVLYQAELIDTFFSYLEQQKRAGHGLIACVVVEAEDSDLYRMREQLRQLNLPIPAQAVNTIRTALSKVDWKVIETKVNSQQCIVPPGEDGLDWLVAFLVGSERKNITSLPIEAHIEAKRILRQPLANKRNRTLDVPDISFTISLG